MATDKTKLIFNPLTGNFDTVQDVTDLVTTSDLANYVPLTQKGAANGVATLDAGGKVPSAQLPTINIVEDTTPQLGGNLDLNTKDIQLDSRQILALRNTAGLKTITKTPAAIFINAGASAVIGSVPGFTGDNYGTEFTVTVAGNNNTGSEISKWLLVTNFNNSNPLLSNFGSLASGDSTMNYTLSAITNGSNIDIILNNSAGPEIVYPRIVFKYQTTI